MKKPRVLVLGGSCFLGAHITRTLLAQGYPVRATRRPRSPTWHVEDLDVQWVELDLEDSENLQRAVTDCVAVIHAAGYCPRSALDLGGARRTGLGQMRNVLEACLVAGVKRMVYVSSPVTLGAGAGPSAVLSEECLYTPGQVGDAYFEVKYAMEAEIYRYLERGLPTVIAIPGTLIGPGDFKPTGMGQLLLQIARGRVMASLKAAINLVDVRDVASSLVVAMERGRPGRRYIMGGTNIDLQDVIVMAAQIAGVQAPHLHLPNRPLRAVAHLTESVGQAVGAQLPSLLVSMDKVIHSRYLESERARGELGHTSRPLQGSFEDGLAWFRRFGYL